MTKLDIMNNRKDEEWNLVNGKVQRVEKIKVVGPAVTNAIKEIVKPKEIVKEIIKPKKIILKEKKVTKRKAKKI